MQKHWFIGIVAVLAVAGSLAFVTAQDPTSETQADAGTPPAATAASTVQPIQFPHNTHAETYKIDCQYCHFSAERSVDAGIPPVSTCIGCHTMIPGAQQPEEVAKIREYYDAGESIPWVRVHKIADHVHFPHMRHIKAGLECQQCHGEIQTKGVLVEPDPVWGKGKMGWCVSCHIESDVRRDCTVCHY